MKFVSLIVLLVVLLCGQSSAQLTWQARELDLTPVPGQEQVVGEFAFTNSGTYPVTIHSVKTNCDCTTAELEKKVYQPSESGIIKAVFKPGNREGHQRKTILVKTDDDKEQNVLLVLKIDLKEIVSIEPKAVIWQAGEEATSKTITIRIKQEAPLKIVDVVHLPRILPPDEKNLPAGSVILEELPVKVELKEIEEGREYQVVLTPEGTRSEGRAKWELKTEQPSSRKIDRIYASVVDEAAELVRAEKRRAAILSSTTQPVSETSVQQ